MKEVIEFFSRLFDSSDWPPRWHCGKWSELHGWLYIISDLMIWSAYFAIPIVILRFISKRNDIRFIKLYFLFAAFILTCGITHLLDAVSFWIPLYRLNALTRFVTGILSWTTVYYIVKNLPVAFSLRSQEALEIEIEQRKLAEEKYKNLNLELTQRVEERTAELQKIIRENYQYKYALEESCIVAITDQKGIIKYANRNFSNISKFSQEELLGKDHRIINSGYHEKEFIRELWTTIANGKIWRGEIKNKAKDGTVYWVDTTIVPFLDEQNKPFQYIAIRADITSRKMVEENLVNSLKEVSDYKFALDESSIVAITDQSGIIKYVNQNFCNISKYSREELIGQDHRIINSGHHEKEFIRELWRTIAKGNIWRGELKNKAKDGSVYWVDTTIVPFLDNKNKPYQYVAIRSDITQRKIAEEENMILNVELENRVRERTDELESFSYSVSHDLRAPLRAINGYARILEEDYLSKFDKEGIRLLGEVQNNARRMGVLIDDLLTFSRLGKKEIRKSENDMNELITSVLAEVGTTDNPNVEIRIDKLHPIKADRALIAQVITNLISNAIKYSSKTKNAIVEISSKKINDEVVYTVHDNGVGFDMEYIDKLFCVFQRLHAQEEFAGTGVGLAIAKRIIQKHEGRIWAESHPGNGATFYFALPD